MTPCITVKIPVVISESGAWESEGSSTGSMGWRELERYLGESHGTKRFYITAVLPLPEAEEVGEIAAMKVEEA